jgi:acetyltransferase
LRLTGATLRGAKIVLHAPELRNCELPQLAIRPYPEQYVSIWKLRDGRTITLRPIRPEDEPLMEIFHEGLSEDSVYFRYFAPIQLEYRVSHERLTRICFNDYDREIAIVVAGQTPETGKEEIFGMGRLSKVHGINRAEFAIILSDGLQGQGLGTHLLSLLVDIGRQEGLKGIFGHILPDNYGMRRVAKKVGFTVSFDYVSGYMKAELAFPLASI